MGLFEQLVSFSLHPTLQGQIIADGYGGELFTTGRLTAVRDRAKSLGAIALELYRAQISLFNPGADVAFMLNDLTEGDMSAAVGMIPYAGTAGKVVIGSAVTGAILAEFAGDARVVVAGAIRAMKVDKVRGRLQAMHALRALRNSGLITKEAIKVVVRHKAFTITDESGRAQLRRALGDAPGKDYDAHHWIPLEVQEFVLPHCIDPNEHGQWLKKAIHTDVHNVPRPGFTFKGKTFDPNVHNEFWKTFFRRHFPNPSEQDILDFAYHLQHTVYKL